MLTPQEHAELRVCGCGHHDVQHEWEINPAGPPCGLSACGCTEYISMASLRELHTPIHPDGTDWSPLQGQRIAADDTPMRPTGATFVHTVTGIVTDVGLHDLGPANLTIADDSGTTTNINARFWRIHPMPHQTITRNTR